VVNGTIAVAGVENLGADSKDLTVVAVIIAREQSTRLPGKVLADLNGKPLLWHMVERLKSVYYIDEVVVATTATNSPRIITFCRDNDIWYTTGSEQDILERTYESVRYYKPDIVVRAWGDCPLIDPDVTNLIINDHMSYGYEYTYNVGYPKGLNVGVLDFKALERAHKTITDPVDRMFFQRRFAKHLKTREFHYWKPLDSINFCVDTPVDLEFVRYVYQNLGDTFTWEQALDYWFKWKNASKELELFWAKSGR
jgi:spore coat polysaccharide biosynthesis protein SpsF (cytidylyltransferase family)